MRKMFDEDVVRELYLYTINKAQIYYNYSRPYILSLYKKYKKGVYNSDAAVKGWERVAKVGATLYVKEFSGEDLEYGINSIDSSIFTRSDIKEVAERMEKYYIEEVQDVEKI